MGSSNPCGQTEEDFARAGLSPPRAGSHTWEEQAVGLECETHPAPPSWTASSSIAIPPPSSLQSHLRVPWRCKPSMGVAQLMNA